jgi:dihydrofolate reductase
MPFVMLSRPDHSPLTTHQFVNEPVRAFAQRLRAEQGKDIWMMGGARVMASFLDSGEIDEFLIHVIPVFIGEGIPLIQLAALDQKPKEWRRGTLWGSQLAVTYVPGRMLRAARKEKHCQSTKVL